MFNRLAGLPMGLQSLTPRPSTDIELANQGQGVTMPKTKELKKLQAAVRQEAYDKLSTVEKLEQQLQNARTGREFQARQTKKLFAKLAKELGITGEYTTHLIAPFVRAKV